MKSSRLFIVIIIVLMVVMILFQMSAPTRFNWNDHSQSYKSKQPFGCYVMDSVLRSSLPQGYEVIGVDIDKYTGKKANRTKHTFLFTNNLEDFIGSVDESFLELIEKGNNAIIATEYKSYYEEMPEEIGLGYRCYSTSYSSWDNISKESLSEYVSYDTVYWEGGEKFAPASYPINSIFSTNKLTFSGDYTILATLDKEGALNEDPDIVAGICEFGKGKIVVVSMPMIFSNYGILNDTIRPLVLRLLSQCSDLPVVRYDPSLWSKVEREEQEEGSPLRYLLANRPLRWALYLALATVVAFILFSARRRQRVIPVIKPPVNHMMNFVKRIGGIYYKRHDNVDLLIKKYVTFSNELRTKAMINVDDYDHIDDELQSLSTRTDIPFNELQQQIYDVWSATNASSISDKRLQQLIDAMNNILHRINI